MPELPKALQQAYADAFAKPETDIPVGRTVVCDFCSVDYTDRPEIGGFIFTAKGCCPTCAPNLLRQIARYREEKFITAICAGDMSFADFIRATRGPDASIKVTTGGFG